MCGRYSLDTPLQALEVLLQPWLRDVDAGWLNHYAPRRLIRPGEPVLALRREHGLSVTSHMLWGLLPGWVKDPLTGPRPINARAETLEEKASFRGPWRHHRCLLPADGFLEQGEQIQRQDQQLFWLAGLWDRWIGPDGSEVETCCVITTRPNALLESLPFACYVLSFDSSLTKTGSLASPPVRSPATSCSFASGCFGKCVWVW